MAVIATLDILTRVNAAQLVSGFQKATVSISSFGDKVLGLKGVLSGLAGYFTASAIYNFVKGEAAAISEAAKMADALGMGTEAFMGLVDGMDKAGISTEQFEASVKNMRESIAGAATGNKSAQQAFSTLGVSLEDIINLPAEQQLMAIADAFRGAGNNVLTMSSALDIFGSRTGAKLLPVLGKGSEALRDWISEAKRAGIAIDDFGAMKVRQANAAMKDIDDSFKGVARTLAVEVAPYIKAVAEAFTQATSTGENMGTTVGAAIQAVAGFLAGAANVAQVFYIAFKAVQVGVNVVILAFVALLDTLAQVEKLLPKSARLGLSDFTDAWNREQFRVSRETYDQLGEAMRGDWWGDAFQRGMDAAKKAADRAARDALGNRPDFTIPDFAQGVGKDIKPAGAYIKGSAEAISKVLEVRRDIEKGKQDQALKVAQQQLAELKKISAEAKNKSNPWELAVANFNKTREW